MGILHITSGTFFFSKNSCKGRVRKALADQLVAIPKSFIG